MRERIIKLIQSAVDGCATYWAGLIADALIAAGVTIPVRCKDCKWYCGIGCIKPHHIRPMKNDDFCSYGERRVDGESM